jgi:ABC-type sugar transport system substrate-binding protein
MQRTGKVALGALAVAIAVSLAACNGAKESGGSGGTSGGTSAGKTAGPAPAGGKRIVFIFKSASNYSEACRRGANQANDELKPKGISVEYFAPDKGDVQKQIQYVDQMVAQKVSAIVIAPNDDKAIVPILKKAADAGVSIYTWDSDAPTSPRKFYVAAVDDVQIGVDIANALAKDMGGKGKVALMSGGRAAANLNLHIQGVEQGLKKYPGITLLTPYIYNEEDLSKAVNLAKAAFQKDPDIGGFAGVNSQAPPGIGEAVTQLNKIGQVKVWGLALPSETRKYLKNGAVNGVMLWDPAQLTYVTAMLVRDDLDGKAPADGSTVGGVKIQAKPDHHVIIPSMTFTKENVDKFNF